MKNGGCESPDRRLAGTDLAFIACLVLGLWLMHAVWLAWDTRPPVWDMAMHQSYALNYVPGFAGASGPFWTWSGPYPPLAHLWIALFWTVLGPDPDVAALSNIPATILLLWALYRLGCEMAGRGAARWACMIAVLTPYTLWISRETVLDYWLSAWFAVFLLILKRSAGFESRRYSILLGLTIACGLLTKWFFAGLAAVPLLLVAWKSKIWRSGERLVHAMDSIIVALLSAGFWYLPNLPFLSGYFWSNMQIGAREGEPPVLSFQSWIYYVRLLEGYQLFGLLFALLLLAAAAAWRRRLLADGTFLAAAAGGGWLVMTLLRTKDPRFTLPILGLLAIPCGAWIHSWGSGVRARLFGGLLVAALGLQAYAANFGIHWLPEEVVLAEGYRGSLQWNWNLYLQHYFHILGPPRREDWRQKDILHALALHAREQGVKDPSLAVVPDLPRLSAANLLLAARLERLILRVDHLQKEPEGPRSFAGFSYAIIVEHDQGMAWTTVHSRGLSQVVLDHPEIFQLIEMYPLPNGDSARLYHISG